MVARRAGGSGGLPPLLWLPEGQGVRGLAPSIMVARGARGLAPYRSETILSYVYLV